MKIFQRLAGASGLAAIVLAVPAAAQSGMTQQFVTAAAQSDEFEIAEGQMAAKMGGPAIQRMGAKMVHDHTITTRNLHKAIARAGMVVPPPPPLRPDQQQMAAQLQGLAGPAFDQAYVLQQVQAHKETLAAVEDYARAGDAKPIRAAALKTVPIVRAHLRMFEKMAAGRTASNM